MYIIHSLNLLQSRTVSHVSVTSLPEASLSFTRLVTCSVCSQILMDILCICVFGREAGPVSLSSCCVELITLLGHRYSPKLQSPI